MLGTRVTGTGSAARMTTNPEKKMTSNHQGDDLQDTTRVTDKGERRCGRRTSVGGVLAGLVLGLLLGAYVLPQALADGPHSRGGKFFHHGPPQTAEEARTRLDKMVDRFLSKVDASQDQATVIRAVADGVAPTLWDARERGQTLRARAVAALTGESVNRDELNLVRADLVKLVDEVTNAMVDELATVAETLTPEQRKKVAERFANGFGLGPGRGK